MKEATLQERLSRVSKWDADSITLVPNEFFDLLPRLPDEAIRPALNQFDSAYLKYRNHVKSIIGSLQAIVRGLPDG